MKKQLLLILIFCASLNMCEAQFAGIKDKIGGAGASMAANKMGLDKILKQPAAITTSFDDVNRQGEKIPPAIVIKNAQPLYLLPKSPTGGFILCAGFFEMTNKSYCLHAGTYGPSAGDGYMFAPVLGPKKDIVATILHNAESKPQVAQHDIQMLLWAIVARTKFKDYAGPIKITALALLSPKELLQLEGGALGFLPINVMDKAKEKMPAPVQKAFEAENNIRNLVASGNYTYADMEKFAILAGMAPARSDVPSGIWTLHPDGYYVCYKPNGYSKTKVTIYVPQTLIDGMNGKQLIYDAVGDIACPANTGAQRLAQTNEPIDPDYNKKLKVKCN